MNPADGREAHVEHGSTSIADLAAVVAGSDAVDAKLALVRGAESWQVVHGELTFQTASPCGERMWQYADEIFLEQRLPAQLVAGLLRQEPQEIGGFKVAAPPTASNAMFRRLAGQAEYLYKIMPWPRTEWTISPSEIMSNRNDKVLVGDGPSFLTFEAAFSSFFYQRPPGNLASQGYEWRIIRLDRRGWLHRVTISPDTLTVTVRGTQLTGASVELNNPTSYVTRPVGRSGKVRLRLPAGLADSSLLLLRNEDDWLDYRYFYSPVPGRERDPSVVWDQPGVELGILIAGGEGLHAEFKREIPITPESRKKVLKTVVAFASGEGGTIVFGVNDDLQPVGLDPAAMDLHMRTVSSMIRDSAAPEPSYHMRAAELDGRALLIVEVAPGGRWYALNPAKPEFYVRRGSSTVPERIEEIAAGFSHESQNRRLKF